MDVNVTLAAWSNLLVYSAMAVYAIAFLVYAFDLFGRQRTADAAARRTAAEARAGARSRAGSRAQGRAGRASAKSSVHRTSRHEQVAVLDAEDEADADGGQARAGSSEPAEAADADGPSAGAGADGPGAGAPERGASGGIRRLARVGTALTVLALLLHIAAIVTRCLSVMRVPWGNMMEYAMTASAIACIVYLVTVRVKDVRYLGTFVTGAVLLALGLSITVFYTPAAQLVPALQNYWIYIHVPIAILSTALLSVSAALAVFQMLRAWREAKSPRILRFMDRLPASDDIEKASYRIAAVGFITWTFTLIAGAIWAEVAWGRYWGWDSKEIWTFVVWVVYAAYLHSRATRGWSPTKVAVLNLVGFLCVIFNFTIVNVFFNGLHAYSGLSS
ncbi:c-type cytochrome biogenesis protein CcsB [Brevibacterium sp. 5221]|uniref:C-type cytochrome biogenesis protein CcsB n=1 Tax=Brevibacterium rongguiense TaxID=2695267 RepID=A0A6N9H7M4_9MICO|nr:c-type cytochrome biogenesis protein CcsB [Brevibacterium rongguiense]MYM19905.1 c-type cytochrome biogenesis protein CcsB [Brevibacterium rongguiense]